MPHKDPQRHRETNRLWYLRHRERIIAKENARSRLKLYGVTQEEWERRLKEQDGKCAICHKPPFGGRTNSKSLGIDHDHVTGRVRGLLCARCNWLVGNVEGVGFEGLVKYFEENVNV